MNEQSPHAADRMIYPGDPGMVQASRLPPPDDGCWHGPARRKGLRFMIGDEPGQLSARRVAHYEAREFADSGFSVLVESMVERRDTEPQFGKMWASAFDPEGRTLASVHFECLGVPQRVETWEQALLVYCLVDGLMSRLIAAYGCYAGFETRASGLCALVRIDDPFQGTEIGGRAIAAVIRRGFERSLSGPVEVGAHLFAADAAGLMVSTGFGSDAPVAGERISASEAERVRADYERRYEPLVRVACPGAVTVAVEHRLPGLTAMPMPPGGVPPEMALEGQYGAGAYVKRYLERTHQDHLLLPLLQTQQNPSTGRQRGPVTVALR